MQITSLITLATAHDLFQKHDPSSFFCSTCLRALVTPQQCFQFYNISQDLLESLLHDLKLSINDFLIINKNIPKLLYSKFLYEVDIPLNAFAFDEKAKPTLFIPEDIAIQFFLKFKCNPMALELSTISINGIKSLPCSLKQSGFDVSPILKQFPRKLNI